MNMPQHRAAETVVREIQALHAKLGTDEKKILAALLAQAGTGGLATPSVKLDFAPDLSVALRGIDTASW